tara:strand:+ start:481 stop:1488 length:1008 start_codon:yes stop_codon:yes gene_type:complete
MEFFNKKEEVIDLKLTQFGRHLLSKGKLKPAFYSFFDDDILYDIEKANMTEAQNESEERIKTTPTMHHQISYSSLEKNFNSNYSKIISGQSKVGDQDLQRTPEKFYALPQPIGTSDVNSQYSPSWQVEFLNGTITGSISSLTLSEKTGGKNSQTIPQIDTHVEVSIQERSSATGDSANMDEFEEGFLDSNFVITSPEEDQYVLLKILENNGLFQKKNFDIELFEVENEVHDGATIETLREIKFSILSDFLQDYEQSFDPDEQNPSDDVNMVDYFFDVLVDDEIDDEIICEHDPVKEKTGVFSEPRAKICQDVINDQKKKVFDIYTDESDSPGEIC